MLLRRAMALDPFSVPVYKGLGQWCYFAGKFDEAEEALKKALEIYPQGSFVHCWLGFVYVAQGRIDDAMHVAKEETEEIFRLQGVSLAYHAAGKSAESDAALRDLITADPDGAADQIAQVHAVRGETDRAFEWLERAFGFAVTLGSPTQDDRLLGNLHADPRWRPFLARMGL